MSLQTPVNAQRFPSFLVLFSNHRAHNSTALSRRAAEPTCKKATSQSPWPQLSEKSTRPRRGYPRSMCNRCSREATGSSCETAFTARTRSCSSVENRSDVQLQRERRMEKSDRENTKEEKKKRKKEKKERREVIRKVSSVPFTEVN